MFEGENIHEFRNFRAIRENFLHEIWACHTYLWLVLAFRKVFSMKWSLLIDRWKFSPSKVSHYTVIKHKLMHFYLYYTWWKETALTSKKTKLFQTGSRDLTTSFGWPYSIIFLNAHINITYVGAIIINAHCTYTMCVHVHVWICAWIADLPSVSNKSSAPTCTKNYDKL